MIDVTAAPYNCRFDWTGNDATATDNYPGLQAAINDAAAITPPGIDLGGAVGDVLQLPKGAGLVSQKLVLPFGVSMQGQGLSYYATVLKMADNFDPNSHFIDLGDASTGLAAMGVGLRDMCLFSRNQDAAAGKAMIYTNNAQDTDPIVGRCRIYAGSRMAIFGEIGCGGATMVNLRNVTCNGFGTKYGNSSPNVLAKFNYSPGCTVQLDGFQVGCYAGGEGAISIGLYLSGGNFDIRRFHAEQIYTGVHINMPNDGRAYIEHANGHPSVHRFIAVGAQPSQAGKIRIKNIINPDSQYLTVFNDLSGNNLTGNVIPETVIN
jgi:hypothetical protein